MVQIYPPGTAATLIAVVGWMLLYFWYAIFSSFDYAKPYPLGVRLVNCLNPDIAMAYGINFLAQYETQGGWSFTLRFLSQVIAFVLFS